MWTPGIARNTNKQVLTRSKHARSKINVESEASPTWTYEEKAGFSKKDNHAGKDRREQGKRKTKI